MTAVATESTTGPNRQASNNTTIAETDEAFAERYVRSLIQETLEEAGYEGEEEDELLAYLVPAVVDLPGVVAGIAQLRLEAQTIDD